MRKPFWKFARDAFAVVVLALVLYAGGFVLLRTFYVDLHKSRGGGVTYFSDKLGSNPDGLLGKTVDFYKYGFILECRFHGSDSAVINGWGMGMRYWTWQKE